MSAPQSGELHCQSRNEASKVTAWLSSQCARETRCQREDVMLIKAIRLGVVLAALVASLHVAAASRYWTLTGVQVGGTQVAGYFSYDDVTQTVSNWNVYVDGRGYPGLIFPSFTFLPGNSDALGEDSLRRGGVLSIMLAWA